MEAIHGPFRATKVWNMVALDFRQIPVGVHWKNMRKYEDCFTSTEAVDWMLEYLKRNPNFGQDKSTRIITIKMLDRLLQHEAFEPVRPQAPKQFKDGDGQLYRFTAKSFENLMKPVSSTKNSVPVNCQNVADMESSIWLEEMRHSLLDISAAELDSINVTSMGNVTANVVNPLGMGNENAFPFPTFVQSAIHGLEHWPNPGPGVPNSNGFERCLLFVVEGFLRGLSQPLIGCAVNDLLRHYFELLSPPLLSRRSSNLDCSSSVESFMQDILNCERRGSYPDVCLETAFAGTIPETRLIRKRPRSNSLFPTTDFLTEQCSGRSGSVECIVPKSASSTARAGSFSIMSTLLNTPLQPVDSGSGSLEKMNPGYRDDTYGDLDDQFFTPMGKLPRSNNLKDLPVHVPVPELIRSFQMVLLLETPEHRAQLERILQSFEKMFKSNQLLFSDDFTTQDFVTHCFTPLVFGETDPTSLHMMLFLIWNRSAIFSPVDDFKLKVELKMKAQGLVPAFCKRITKNEYEEQKSLQNGHMKELLNDIVTNVTMNIKEKRKKLKQFQKSYPEIYMARFTNCNSEESIFAACAAEKPKARLTKFKSLRL